MSFVVKIPYAQTRDLQIANATTNFVHAFFQTIGGIGVVNDRDDRSIPKCEGLTEWAQENYNIGAVVNYRTQIQTLGNLTPNPMDLPDQDFFWDQQYVPVEGSLKNPMTKDEERQFLDPAFVGPRSMEERKFFRSEAIKLGMRKKISARYGYFGHAYRKCQTPELKRWGQDLAYGCLLAAKGEDAWQWVQDRGYETAVFWQRRHMDVASIEFTMPGCEDKPRSYEQLLFVMKFGGGNY